MGLFKKGDIVIRSDSKRIICAIDSYYGRELYYQDGQLKQIAHYSDDLYTKISTEEILKPYPEYYSLLASPDPETRAYIIEVIKNLKT